MHPALVSVKIRFDVVSREQIEVREEEAQGLIWGVDLTASAGSNRVCLELSVRCRSTKRVSITAFVQSQSSIGRQRVQSDGTSFRIVAIY